MAALPKGPPSEARTAVRSPDIPVRGGVLPGVPIQDALPDGVAASPPRVLPPAPELHSMTGQGQNQLELEVDQQQRHTRYAPAIRKGLSAAIHSPPTP